MNQNKSFVLCQNIVNYAKRNDQGDHMPYLLMDYFLHSSNYKKKRYFENRQKKHLTLFKKRIKWSYDLLSRSFSEVLSLKTKNLEPEA